MLANYGFLSSPVYILNPSSLLALLYNLHSNNLFQVFFDNNTTQASYLIDCKAVPFQLADDDYLHINTYNNIEYRNYGSLPYGDGKNSISLSFSYNGNNYLSYAYGIKTVYPNKPIFKYTFTRSKLNLLFRNDYTDYSNYSMYKMYIPFSGYEDIEYTYIKNASHIDIVYYLDYSNCLLSCNIIANMGGTDVRIREKNIDIGYNIPITYSDNAALYSAMIEMGGDLLVAGSTALGVPISLSNTVKSYSKNISDVSRSRKRNKQTGRLNIQSDRNKQYNESETSSYSSSVKTNPLYRVREITNGLSQFVNSVKGNMVSSSYSSNNASNSLETPFILYEHPYKYETNELKSLVGKPLNKVLKLSKLRGFTKIDTIHLDIPCLESELSEIEELLYDGVILNTNAPIPDPSPEPEPEPTPTPTPAPDTPKEDDPISPNAPTLPEGETATMLCCFNGKFRVTGMRGKPSDTHRPRNHYGLDLVGMDTPATNTPVYAISSGWVKLTDEGDRYLGKCVHVQMDNKNYYGEWILYGHLSKFEVKNGQYVEKGQLIGIMGNTGDSDGWHTHLEWRNKYDKYDPDFSKYDICKFTGIPNTSVEGQNVHIGSPVYKTANGASVQSKLGLENQTIEYLESYEYADDLMKKIDDHTK